jgi:leader peptidase (prepilin peptidase)/N-methyltransferase
VTLIDQTALLTGAALLGAPFIGSFLATAALRLPAAQPVVLARSACPRCDAKLDARDLVPLLSWIALGGRCRHCSGSIPAYYPGVELAALAIAVWAATVFSGGPLLVAAGLGWGLLLLALIDRRSFWLPDVFTLPLLAAGLVCAAWRGGDALLASAIGAALGYGLLAGIAWFYQRVRGREGLGLGDAKLLAVAGAWVGWQGLPMVLLAGSVAALAVVGVMAWRRGNLDWQAPLPFGPFLAAGLWLVFLYGQPVAL